MYFFFLISAFHVIEKLGQYLGGLYGLKNSSFFFHKTLFDNMLNQLNLYIILWKPKIKKSKILLIFLFY